MTVTSKSSPATAANTAERERCTDQVLLQEHNIKPMSGEINKTNASVEEKMTESQEKIVNPITSFKDALMKVIEEGEGRSSKWKPA